MLCKKTRMSDRQLNVPVGGEIPNNEMAARDPNGEDKDNADEIRRDHIRFLNIHLENFDIYMSDSEQLLRNLGEYLNRQVAECQPMELGTTILDLKLRDFTLYPMLRGIKEMEKSIRGNNSILKIFRESLQQSISFLDESERIEKCKQLEYKNDIEKQKTEIETKLKFNSSVKTRSQSTFIESLLPSNEAQMRFEAETNRYQTLSCELKTKAETQKRRVEAALRKCVLLLRQTGIVRRSREQEKRLIKHELRRKKREILRNAANVMVNLQEATSILGLIAAELELMPLRQEESGEASGLS